MSDWFPSFLSAGFTRTSTPFLLFSLQGVRSYTKRLMPQLANLRVNRLRTSSLCRNYRTCSREEEPGDTTRLEIPRYINIAFNIP